MHKKGMLRFTLKKKAPSNAQSFFLPRLIAALTCGFRLLLALYAGLFIMLTLTNLGHNAGARALTLETLEGAFQRLVFLDAYFRHLFSLPSPISPWLSPYLTADGDRVHIIRHLCQIVNPFFVNLHTCHNDFTYIVRPVRPCSRSFFCRPAHGSANASRSGRHFLRSW